MVIKPYLWSERLARPSLIDTFTIGLQAGYSWDGINPESQLDFGSTKADCVLALVTNAFVGFVLGATSLIIRRWLFVEFDSETGGAS
jgi:hypothetical protein